MRIISGKYRAKLLKSPKTGEVRPTSDRAREALFNILHSKIGGNWEKIKFLDVFAGTGAVGLEALSRGANLVGFIDINTSNLMQNVKLFPVESNKIKVYKTDVSKLMPATEHFNVLFLDAPYEKNLSELALALLAEKKWVDDEAFVIVETRNSEDFLASDGFYLEDERVYGPAKFRFFNYRKT